MPKTKADLEKDIKSLQGKLSRCTRKVAGLKAEIEAGGAGHAGLRKRLMKAEGSVVDAKAKMVNAQQAARVAVDARALADDKTIKAAKNVAGARALCGLVVTKVEQSAWAHKAEQVGLEPGFLAEVKAFAEGG